MNRREFLLSSTVGGSVILSGCSSIQDQVSGLGAPEKGEKLGERTFGNSFITTIELYEGGYADVTLREDHSLDRIGLTHDARDFGTPTEPLSDAYDTWELPEFSGPESYQIGQPIQSNNDSYPSNLFKFRVAAEQGTVTFGVTEKTASFPVPESFVPEGTPIQEEL
ncbi:hypothetical protein PM038_00005 [Halorubrum ezzemoulense]|uniref:hypothetical protein n=1 Tax=Halorubrum ezzemoulense TaxID=337243 RepID=UPI00232ACE44|nr:hypothetical protein [Halorubrum ezzemoulense]MDB2283657.1 hypothetical protein [Halorubrum ezzemoulense]